MKKSGHFNLIVERGVSFKRSTRQHIRGCIRRTWKDQLRTANGEKSSPNKAWVRGAQA